MPASEHGRPAAEPALPADPDSRRNALFVVLLFLLASVLAGGGAALYFRTEAAEIYDDAERQVRLLSDIKQRQLVQWRRERLGDAQVLFDRNANSTSVVRTLTANDPASVEQVRQWLGSYLSGYGDYDRAFFVSADGQLRLSSPVDGQMPSTTLLREAADAMDRRGPKLVDFYLDETDGAPHLALVIPVIAGDPEGDPAGTMILRIDPGSFIYPSLQIEQGNSSTGDTELLRRDGDSLVVLNRLRFEPDAALRRRIPATGEGMLDATAANGAVGLVRGVDYRGEDALGFVTTVDDAPWILVTRVEIGELENGLRRHLWLVTTGVVLLLGAVGTALLLWRRDQRLRGYQKQVQLASALQESEERLRLALASASQGLYDLDLQTGVAIVSPEYAMMIGHDPATFTESLESWRARVHPDDRASASAALDDYLSGRIPAYHIEFRLATAGGGWKWVLSVGQLVERDASGAPKRMIGTHTDITQMKWAQEGQARVASQLRSLLANSPTVVYSVHVVGGQLRPVAISENVERLLGYTPVDVMQPGFWDRHVHPDDRARALPGPLGPRDEATHVYRFRSAEGDYRWIQDHVSVLRRSPNGTPLELIGAWSDITAQYEAEQALRASEERLRLAMTAAKQGLWDLNLVTREAVTSPDYATMLGYDPATFAETADDWNGRLHPDDYERAQLIFRDYVLGRRPDYDVECRQRTADGRWLWVRSVGQIIERAADGAPARMLGIHTDISARKEAEATAARLSRLYMTRSACNAAIVRCSTPEELFPQICQALVEAGGFDMAWVGRVDPSTRNVNVVARHGWGLEYLDTVSVSADPASPRSYGPAGTAIKENRATWVDDFAVNPNTTLWHNDATKFGWVAAASFPLRESHQVIGALTIYLRSLGNFDDDVRELLTKMSDDISFALDAFHRNALRLEAEARMRQSEARYRSLFAESTVPMILGDPATGLLIDVNEAAASFYGWRQSEMKGMPTTQFSTHPDPTPDVMGAIADARRSTGFMETRHRLASGEVRDVEIYPAAVQIDDRRCVLATVIDVTARRQAERRVDHLSKLYLTLTRCNEAIVRSSRSSELFPKVCRAAVESGGFSMAWAGLIDRTAHVLRVDAASGAGAEYLDTLEVELGVSGPFWQGPVSVALREGRPFWIDDFETTVGVDSIREAARRFNWVSGAIIPLMRGATVEGVFAVATEVRGGFDNASRELLVEMGADISFALEVFEGQEQRNEAEARLRQSEARYRTLFADSGVPMLLIDPSNGHISDANQAAAAFYGWTTDTLRAMTVADINTLDVGPLRETLERAGAVTRGRFSFTHRIASGDTRKVEAFTARVVVDGHARLLAIIVDVTAQRLAEAALREQEHMLVEAQRLAHLGSWTYGGNGRMSWSEEMFRLFGLSPESAVPGMDDFARLVHPDDWPLVQQTMSDNMRGKLTPDIEYRALLPDGTVRYVSASGELRSDPVLGDYLTGTVQDITERKRAEQALTQSEERLRLALGAARQGLWDYDIVVGTALNSVPNPSAPGFSAETVQTPAGAFLDNVHVADRERVGTALAAYASGQADHYEEEFRLGMLGATPRWVQSVGRIVERRPDGTPTRIVGVMTDITERRAFLEALSFRDRALESSQSAIAIGDLDGNMTYVNRAFEELWNLSNRDQAIGRSIVPFWEEPAKAIEVIAELNRTGRPWTGELRAVTATGQHLDILVSAARVTDEYEQPIGLVGAFIDMTDRKLNEKAMAASLEEKESLLKEVHHRVKNNLQVISSLLRLELGRTTDGGVKAVLGEMQNRVVSMALLHETLYRSDNLARADLSSYLVRLVNQLFRSSAPPSGRVVLHTDIEQTFVDLEQAVPCGLLVTELVSNSLKHAFQDGRAGEVRVTLHHPDNGPGLVLTVADNGPGLPADFDVRRTQSLGLQLVSDLTRQLRGTLTIAGQPGASFSLAFTPRATAAPIQG